MSELHFETLFSQLSQDRYPPRSTETRVHFNDSVFPTIRRQSVLDVTLSNDSQMPDDFKSSSSQHMIVIIR